MRVLKIIITGFIVSIPSNVLAVTNAHIGYCDDIESTAAALKCITEHKEESEKELSKAFDELNTTLEEDQKSHFLEAHKDWITYRDSQCKWESKTEQPSLSKLHELSCLTKLTEERTARLTNKVMMQEHPEEAQEFSTFPRWLNTLYKKHASIIWDIKSQQNGDIDCDDIEDRILEGVSFSEDEALKERYKLNKHIAIVSGKDNGKPSYYIIDATEMCPGVSVVDVNFVSREKDDSESESDENVKECLKGVEIVFEESKCDPISIFEQIVEE